MVIASLQEGLQATYPVQALPPASGDRAPFGRQYDVNFEIVEGKAGIRICPAVEARLVASGSN
jgi:hypothetical protein